MPQFAIQKPSQIRQCATSKLLGRSTASTGPVEELTATTAKGVLGLANVDTDTSDAFALVNGSNSQSFYLYNDETGDTDFERAAVAYDSNVMTIHPEASGTGSNRQLQIFSTSAQLTIQTKVAGTVSIFSSYTNRGRIDFFGGGSGTVQLQFMGNGCSSMTFGSGIFNVAGNSLQNSGTVVFSGLPTSDPSVAGELWNDSGTLKISAG